jgi:uncharacterized protein (TIGR02271 family)
MDNNQPDDKTRPIPVVADQHREQFEATQAIPVVPQSADKVVVQLRAEELVPTTTWVESGAVLVKKGVEVYPQTIPVEVLHEEVNIERVPVNRVLAEGEIAMPWQDGDVLVIPIVHEEAVVVKRLVVREELRVSKVRVPGMQEVKDSVRRENITIETTGNAKVQPGWNETGQGPA